MLIILTVRRLSRRTAAPGQPELNICLKRQQKMKNLFRSSGDRHCDIFRQNETHWLPLSLALVFQFPMHPIINWTDSLGDLFGTYQVTCGKKRTSLLFWEEALNLWCGFSWVSSKLGKIGCSVVFTALK